MITIKEKNYLTVQEVAELLKVSARTILKLVADKKLQAFKPSERKTYFSEEMIQNYLEGK